MNNFELPFFCTDPIRVGYEETVYTTTEGQRQIQLCAVIYDPAAGGTPRPFFLFASTTDDTAGKHCIFLALFAR